MGLFVGSTGEPQMNNRSDNKKYNESRILLHSQRNIFANFHYRLGLYEFEDIIPQIDSVDLLAPQPRNWFKYGTRIANRLTTDHAIGINPGIPTIKIKKNYDLFFAVVQFPKDLLHVKYVEGWEDHCKISICWLNEIWLSEIYKYRYFLKILSKFDYVVLTQSKSVHAVQEKVQGECFYLPLGIDAIQFCPYPEAFRREIDVYSIGRKSEVTHKTLLRMIENNNIFYVYDTIIGDQVNKPMEHRLLFANILKRSKYFIVNPGRITRPDITQGQSEFGNRYFEGAASGTIMIGEFPQNEEFRKYFNWSDALIHLPYGSDEIDTILTELDKQPRRQEEIRRNNVINSLRRHDWAHRWEAILDIAGLDPTPELFKRKTRLENLSQLVEKGQNDL